MSHQGGDWLDDSVNNATMIACAIAFVVSCGDDVTSECYLS